MLMRTAVVIAALTLLGLGLVKMRRDEAAALHEIQQLSRQLTRQRRQLWDLDYRLGELTSVQALRTRAQEMGVVMAPPYERRLDGQPGTFLAMEPSR